MLLLMLYFAFCVLLVNKFLKRKPDDPEAFLRRMEKGPNASYFKIIRDSLPWFPSQPAKDVYTESYDGLKLHAKYLTQPDSPSCGRKHGALWLQYLTAWSANRLSNLGRK